MPLKVLIFSTPIEFPFSHSVYKFYTSPQVSDCAVSSMLLTVLATGPVMVRRKANATMACRPLLELSCGSTSRVAHRTLVEKARPRQSGGPSSAHTAAAVTGLTCSCSTNISSSSTLNNAPPAKITISRTLKYNKGKHLLYFIQNNPDFLRSPFFFKGTIFRFFPNISQLFWWYFWQAKKNIKLSMSMTLETL